MFFSLGFWSSKSAYDMVFKTTNICLNAATMFSNYQWAKKWNRFPKKCLHMLPPTHPPYFCNSRGNWGGGFFFLWPLPTACGILAPQPGIEPPPAVLEAQSLKHWTSREVPHFLTLGSTIITVCLVCSFPAVLSKIPKLDALWCSTLWCDFYEFFTFSLCPLTVYLNFASRTSVVNLIFAMIYLQFFMSNSDLVIWE